MAHGAETHKKISNEMDDLLVVRSLKLRLVHQYKNSLTG